MITKKQTIILTTALILAFSAFSIGFYSLAKKFFFRGNFSNQIILLENGPSLSLEPSTKDYQVGDELKVDVILDTASQQTAGVDVVLEYDPQTLELIPQDKILDEWLPEDSPFKNYPRSFLDLEKGNLSFSALMEAQKSFKGKTKIATLHFKALTTKTTKIDFVFKRGSTTDSNIADFFNASDMLNKVQNGSYKIK